jgi:hypothetical protein
MRLSEPAPPFPYWPRFSDLPFPPYRFVPGLNPHPILHPHGHSFSHPRELPPAWDPEEWRTLRPYLYGIDLYNYAYWWECHEVLEGLWRVAERTSLQASFIKGIIHVAVANLNRHRSKGAGAKRQAEKGLARFERVQETSSVYMGLEIPVFARGVRASFFSDRLLEPAMIRLLA